MRSFACVLSTTLVVSSHGNFQSQLTPQALLDVEKAIAQKSFLHIKQPEHKAGEPETEHKRHVRQGKKVLKETDHKEWALLNTGEMLVSFVIWLVLYTILALYYKAYVLHNVEDLSKDYIARKKSKHRTSEVDPEVSLTAFSTPLFNCHKHPDITFWSCLCPGIRWADTMGKLGLHGFWSGFWIMFFLFAIAFIPMATLPCHVIVMCYMTYHRQVFRRAFEFEDQGPTACVKDCFAYMCCGVCALAQEARHTRLACMMEHKAVCVTHDDTVDK